jgi:phage recombination protein Bet
MANEVAKKTEHEVQYEVNGKEVKLSPSIVAQFVTKGNGQISKTEAVNFIQLCKGAGLNPFLNEAYLVKFGDQPAQMITSKEAFMKRAEANTNFKGFKAGIIVERDGEMKKLDGALKLKNDELIGAWAEVYRSDRDVPTYVEVAFEEFAKYDKYGKNLQSTWKNQPANMIRKVAVVNALREAFPNTLGAMYTEDDKSPQEVERDIKQAEKEKGSAMMDLMEDDQPEKENDENIQDVEFEEVEEQTTKQDEAQQLLDEMKEGADHVDNIGEVEQSELPFD